MINGITWLVVFQFLGTALVTVTDLPVPGPVVGMVLLLVALVLRKPGPGAHVHQVADGLLAHLQLFFIPAGVGIIVYLHTLAQDALPIVVALVVSWLVGLLVVGAVVQLWLRRRPPADPSGPTGELPGGLA